MDRSSGGYILTSAGGSAVHLNSACRICGSFFSPLRCSVLCHEAVELHPWLFMHNRDYNP